MTHSFQLGRSRPKTSPSETAAHEIIADTVGWQTVIEDVRRDAQNNLMAAVRITGRWVMSDWPAADILLWLPATAAATMQLAIQECCMVYGMTGVVAAEVERLERLYEGAVAWGGVYEPGADGGRGVAAQVGAASPR